MAVDKQTPILSAIAVDDEPFALRLLADDIQRIPSIELVNTYPGAGLAMQALQQKPVDLMFLDIQMPGITGTQFLRGLPNPPLVIMTTAYDHFAVEGFELNVVDYLVKPIPFERLEKAVVKAHERYAAKALRDQSSTESFFFIRSEYKEIKIFFDDILYVEGLKDYVKIFLEGQPHPVLTRMNLKAMESRLPSDRFVRVHNSYIVPLRKITSFQRSQIFVGEEAIPVGDKFYAQFIRQYRGVT